MIDLHALPNLAGTFIWQTLLAGESADYERQQSIRVHFRVHFHTASLTQAGAVSYLAATLVDLGEDWLRPGSSPKDDWVVNLPKLQQRFRFVAQTWLTGDRVVPPEFDEVEWDGRKQGVVRLTLSRQAPAKPSWWSPLVEAIEVKPRLGGISVDVKKLGGWLQRLVGSVRRRK